MKFTLFSYYKLNDISDIRYMQGFSNIKRFRDDMKHFFILCIYTDSMNSNVLQSGFATVSSLLSVIGFNPIAETTDGADNGS